MGRVPEFTIRQFDCIPIGSVKNSVRDECWYLLCHLKCQISPFVINVSFEFSKLSIDVRTNLLMYQFFYGRNVSLMALPIAKISAGPFITMGKIQFNSFNVSVFRNLYCHEQIHLLQAKKEISIIVEEYTVFGIKL